MSVGAWLLRFAVVLGLASCTSVPPADAPEAQRIGNLLVSGVPPIPEGLRSRMQQYRNTRTAWLLDWLDEGVLVTTRFGDSPQLHRVRMPGGAREQLSFFAEPVRLAYVPPKGQRLVVNGGTREYLTWSSPIVLTGTSDATSPEAPDLHPGACRAAYTGDVRLPTEPGSCNAKHAITAWERHEWALC